MTTTAAQQVALDNALVPLEKRVGIGKCNQRIDLTKTQKEPTYQVVLDALALTTCYPAFLITADVPEIYMHYAYKSYPAFTTGAATPKKARKFKKPASPSKKRTLVTVEEEELEPAKKIKKAPETTKKSKGIDLLSKDALLEEAQLKKVLKRSRQETNIHQAGGSSNGDGLQQEVLGEPKGKSVLKTDSFEREYESWGDSGDEANEQGDDEDVLESDDDHEQADDEKLDVDEEEYDRIDKELYGDVNVRLTDAEQDDKGKEDADMTDAEHVQVEQTQE
ncbi:hypothetical protein Tco_0749971 [Tanacetum coccineum]|uniref:Uncharacterized protein n=1 Tax=Tanacetum coccineum TaxID=301880 RepID=A0ABQ4Z066_9ASTR